MDICTKDAEMDTVNLKPDDATFLWNKDNVIHLRLQTEVIFALSSESFIL